MSYQTPWHKVVPIGGPAISTISAVSGNTALEIAALGQPNVARVDWTRPGLNARIAYQMGEIATAEVIIKNALAEIDCWLPSSLKLFAILLYEGRLAFFMGELELATACYERAYDLMTTHQIDRDWGCAAADLYDEWGDCHMLMGLAEEAMTFYQLALNTDLGCYELNPLQMSPARLAKLADFFALKGAPVSAKHCLQLAEARAQSPVEAMFVRTFCLSQNA